VTFYPSAGVVPLAVDAHWRAPDGQVRTGILSPPFGATAGGAVPVWVDRAGELADPLLGRVQLVTQAHLAEEVAVGTLAIALIAAYWLARRVLDGRRMAAWDADWLATGPRWSSRH
jgi:hypothetical protein